MSGCTFSKTQRGEVKGFFFCNGKYKESRPNFWIFWRRIISDCKAFQLKVSEISKSTVVGNVRKLELYPFMLNSFIFPFLFIFQASFWCLVSMFERPKYLAGYFNDSLGKWVPSKQHKKKLLHVPTKYMQSSLVSFNRFFLLFSLEWLDRWQNPTCM